MLDLLIASHVVLWIVVLVLAVLLVATLRQLGVLHERIAPLGALALSGGLQVGERAPAMRVPALQGGELQVGKAPAHASGQLLAFVSPSCPMCKTLLPTLGSLSLAEPHLQIVLVSDGDEDAQRRMLREHRLSQMPAVHTASVGLAYRISKLPYAVLVDGEGVVRAQGLVNSREHLESLLLAAKSGHGDLQSWLHATGRSGAPGEASGGFTNGAGSDGSGPH